MKDRKEYVKELLVLEKEKVNLEFQLSENKGKIREVKEQINLTELIEEAETGIELGLALGTSDGVMEANQKIRDYKTEIEGIEKSKEQAFK